MGNVAPEVTLDQIGGLASRPVEHTLMLLEYAPLSVKIGKG